MKKLRTILAFQVNFRCINFIQCACTRQLYMWYACHVCIAVLFAAYEFSKLISSFYILTTIQDGGFSLDSMQRLCTLEAELSLLLRISHKYGRLGSQHLFSMGSLQHIASCRALHLPVKVCHVFSYPSHQYIRRPYLIGFE